jgi:hypothetical protein
MEPAYETWFEVLINCQFTLRIWPHSGQVDKLAHHWGLGQPAQTSTNGSQKHALVVHQQNLPSHVLAI